MITADFKHNGSPAAVRSLMKRNSARLLLLLSDGVQFHSVFLMWLSRLLLFGLVALISQSSSVKQLLSKGLINHANNKWLMTPETVVKSTCSSGESNSCQRRVCVVLYEAGRAPPWTSQTEGLTVKNWINFSPTNKCEVHEGELPLNSLLPSSFVSCRVTKNSQEGTFPSFLCLLPYAPFSF